MPNERPRLALPFTVLTAPGVVRLVAGEEFRYTLEAPGIDSWLPQVLAKLDGRHSLDELLKEFDAPRRSAAMAAIQRLYSERVVDDGPAVCAHPAASFSIQASGTGPLVGRLNSSASGGRKLRVFCQDRLDFHAALAFNRECLKDTAPWLWVSSGALARAYVSPVFLPECGPCLECLLGHFQKISPASEIYEHLISHSAQGNAVLPVEITKPALSVLEALARWKTEQLAAVVAPAALYQLHVLEMATMTVAAHDVGRDAECRACGWVGPQA